MYISKSVTAEALDARPSGSNANLGNARVDMASGYYYQTVTVNVSPSDDFTTLVYTEDGNDPTTDSPMITSTGKSFTYNTEGTHTLKVGVKGANSVTNIQTYNYTITNNIPTDITIYVRADKEPLYLYAWDANGTLTSAWPGTQLTEMKSANGVNFYYMTFPKPAEGYTLNYILNQGSDATKTKNNENISSTIFTALGNANEYAINLNSDYSVTDVTDPIEYKEVTVFVRADRYPLYLYAWYGTDTKLLGNFPGKQMSHTACINGKAWFCESIRIQSNRYPINLVVSDGTTQSGDFLNVTDDIIISYDKGWKDQTSDYAGYPVAWFGQGEICAFFSDINNWGNIHAHAWGSAGGYTGDWPGTACEELGYNEWGQKIYKWTYTGDLTNIPEYIIFNNGSNEKQTANCKFKNGAWYNTSNTGENIAAVSTDVSPSTEISIATLGSNNPPTETNWNGKSEKVAQNDGNNDMSKTFSLAAGKYTVQAIVRGTENGKVTLSAKTINDVVTLTGLDNAVSTVEPNGAVDPIATGNNNGWHKAEVTFTLDNDENVEVTLSSTAETWQLGALKVLSVKSDLPSNTRATTGVGLDNTYVDVRGVTDFSFYDRGKNLNALIKANDGTQPASLPYNVIVDGKCDKLQLTDGNYSFKNAGSQFTAKEVKYDRTFVASSSTRGSEQYNTSTICLPFGLTAEEAAAAGTFWALESYDDVLGNISFVEVTEPEANTPYLFDPATANPFSSLTNKTIPSTELLTVTKDGVSFIGVNERTHLVSGNGVTYYGYQNGAFVQVGTGNGAYINPFRAYLKISSPNAGARIAVLFDGENGGETGIQVVKPAMEQKGEQPIYNLSGQRVQTPSKKGIYIKGGKKYIVK